MADEHSGPPAQPIAFLGLGAMGGGMAARLLERGWPLVVHNRTAAKAAPLVAAGARAASSPAEAAADVDVVLLSLSDEAAVEQVIFGELRSVLRPGLLVVDTSTVSPPYARATAARLAELGVRRVEACVVGNPRLARNGWLRVFASGAEADIDATEDILRTIGHQLVRLGEPGRAATMKLVFNLLLGAQVASLAEAVGYGVDAGLDRAELIAAIAGSGFSSKVMTFRADIMRTREYDPPAFRTRLMEKDLRVALADAAGHGRQMPVLAEVRRGFAAIVDAGDGDLDAAVAVEYAAGAPIVADVPATRDPSSSRVADDPGLTR